MTNFLNKVEPDSRYLFTSARDDGTGNPVTDVQVTGSFERLSTEPKPTAADGVKDGNTLMLVDTAQVFKFYKGVWYEL
jgi:hypothetical protein